MDNVVVVMVTMGMDMIVIKVSDIYYLMFVSRSGCGLIV